MGFLPEDVVICVDEYDSSYYAIVKGSVADLTPDGDLINEIIDCLIVEVKEYSFDAITEDGNMHSLILGTKHRIPAYKVMHTTKEEKMHLLTEEQKRYLIIDELRKELDPNAEF